MRFKTPELTNEFHQAHPKAIAIAVYADWWALRYLGHDLMVTDVGRSQGEYDAIYASKIAQGLYYMGEDGKKHYAGPRPHLADPLHGVPSHAVDFRTIGEMNDLKVAQLRDHLNSAFPRRDLKPTAIYHDVGAGKHLHIQAEV